MDFFIRDQLTLLARSFPVKDKLLRAFLNARFKNLCVFAPLRDIFSNSLYIPEVLSGDEIVPHIVGDGFLKR
jgi:hypothetical protein